MFTDSFGVVINNPNVKHWFYGIQIWRNLHLSFKYLYWFQLV